ncbi:MAG: sensor histidine kinase [Dehalococcoidia bacterium]
MSRLPIRARLTLTFGAAMALVLVAVGAVLYARTSAALLEQVDNGLEAHADTVVALVAGGGVAADAGLSGAGDDAFVQVLRADGGVAYASAGVVGGPLIRAEDIERGRRGRSFIERAGVPAMGGAPARLLVGPSGDGGVVVVGASLDDRAEALSGLAAQLLLIGPAALAVTSIAGYALAGAALRPVERMRVEAAKVAGGGASGRRLPLPTAHDEVYRLGETLNEMIERLEASAARERAFVADASHELRTPLAALRTELDLALRRPRSAEEATDALRSVEEEVGRLRRLVDDLLTLARLDDDGGSAQLRQEEVAVLALCGRVQERFEAEATALRRTVEVRCPDGLSVDGDAFRLEQALANLVDNALRHGAGAVVIEVHDAGDGVELAVRDSGGGFERAFIDRAFERFTRGDESRAGEGTGLGLAIVRSVARAHGGEARIDRAADAGAAVVVWLPKS